MKEGKPKPIEEALADSPIMFVREVPDDSDELEEQAWKNNPRFMKILREAAKDFADGKSKDWSDM